MSEAQIADAYKQFISSSRTRDKDPDGFSAARMRFYGLKNGEDWINQEKSRITLQKIEPAIREYQKMYEELERQTEIQKAYTDSFEVIRDQQSNIKSTQNKGASFFGKLLKQQEAQKKVYDRYMELTSPQKVSTAAPIQQTNIPFMVKIFMNYPPEFVTLLNIITVSLIVTIAYVGYQKNKNKKSSISNFYGRT